MKIKNLAFSGILSLLVSVGVFAQDCRPATTTQGAFVHANRVRALVMASGSAFWDGDDAQFFIEDADGTYATIFSQGLWIGGFDPAGNLSLSANTYGLANVESDYYPGPLVPGIGAAEAETCSNFNQVWSVYRYEIEAHLADFTDNGVIDNPIPALMAWPGQKNPHFSQFNGFELPLQETGSLAPFWDEDQDGLYDPLQGDFPIVPQSNILPDQIVWSVYHAGPGLYTATNGDKIPVEIQQTTWAFNCDDNPVLNDALFSSYRLIHRGNEPYDSVYVSMWHDFDLGCYTDDYVGSAPDQNSFFVYNVDNVDDNPCQQDVAGAGLNPPVQAVTLLNKPLNSFIAYQNGGFAPAPPPATTDPNSLLGYYYYMTGRFRDGTPITEGGTGYDPMSTDFTNYQFSGDPNDPEQWSALQEGGPVFDYRGIGSVKLGSFLPGEIQVIDVAWTHHRAPDANHLANVTAMYEGVAEVQLAYDGGFENACTSVANCAEDCVWTGDINADGIANHEDVAALGFSLDQSGPTRSGPYNWYPRSADSWSDNQLLDDVNRKHADADGNGMVTEADLEKTEQHYGFTQPGYLVPEPIFTAGEDLTLKRLGSGDFLNIQPGQNINATLRLNTDVADLRALSFEVFYDERFIDRITRGGSLLNTNDYLTLRATAPGVWQFGGYLVDDTETFSADDLSLVQVQIRDEFPADISTGQTEICFRNIKAYLTDGTPVALGADCVPVQINGVVATSEPAWAMDFQVAPNPTDGWLKITTDQSLDQVQLLDYQGRLLRTLDQHLTQIDLRDLPNGFYLLRLQVGEQWVTRKIVKER